MKVVRTYTCKTTSTSSIKSNTLAGPLDLFETRNGNVFTHNGITHPYPHPLRFFFTLTKKSIPMYGYKFVCLCLCPYSGYTHDLHVPVRSTYVTSTCMGMSMGTNLYPYMGMSFFTGKKDPDECEFAWWYPSVNKTIGIPMCEKLASNAMQYTVIYFSLLKNWPMIRSTSQGQKRCAWQWWVLLPSNCSGASYYRNISSANHNLRELCRGDWCFFHPTAETILNSKIWLPLKKTIMYCSGEAIECFHLRLLLRKWYYVGTDFACSLVVYTNVTTWVRSGCCPVPAGSD